MASTSCCTVTRYLVSPLCRSFQMYTGEGAGVFLRPKTLVEGLREGVGPRHGFRERLRGWRWRCAFYSAAAGDLPFYFHWFSRERLVAVVRSGKPNFYWLRPRRGSTAGSREALQRARRPLMILVEKGNPRQGRLVEEEEEISKGEASADSSGGILKLA